MNMCLILLVPYSYYKSFRLSHRTVPNEAGDHRAARTPPLAEGGSFATPLPSGPHKYITAYTARGSSD